MRDFLRFRPFFEDGVRMWREELLEVKLLLEGVRGIAQEQASAGQQVGVTHANCRILSDIGGQNLL